MSQKERIIDADNLQHAEDTFNIPDKLLKRIEESANGYARSILELAFNELVGEVRLLRISKYKTFHVTYFEINDPNSKRLCTSHDALWEATLFVFLRLLGMTEGEIHQTRRWEKRFVWTRWDHRVRDLTLRFTPRDGVLGSEELAIVFGPYREKDMAKRV